MYLRKIRLFCLVLALCMSATACTVLLFDHYGRIDASEEVTQAFNEYRVNPEFRYYASGPLHKPNALMGLHRNYRLDPSTLWREEVAMSTSRMRFLVEEMNVGYFRYLQGFELRDNSGRPIGVWYSRLEARTFLRMNDDGTVRIDTPNLTIHEGRRGDSLGTMHRH